MKTALTVGSMILLLCVVTGAQVAVPIGIHAISVDELQNTKVRCEDDRVVPVGSALALRRFLMSTGVLRLETMVEPQNLATVDSLLSAAPFDVVIMGPMGQACLAASEAKRRFVPFTVTADQVNASVLVEARPARNFLIADSVERVVLKRNGVVTQPMNQKITTVTIQNGLGATKELATGTFAFGITDFSPDAAPLTIVVVGATRNFEWTFSRTELLNLY